MSIGLFWKLIIIYNNYILYYVIINKELLYYNYYNIIILHLKFRANSNLWHEGEKMYSCNFGELTLYIEGDDVLRM